MTEKEFSLSEKLAILVITKIGKAGVYDVSEEIIFKEDVKEFIRRLKEIPMANRLAREIKEDIDKLAGDKLK